MSAASWLIYSSTAAGSKCIAHADASTPLNTIQNNRQQHFYAIHWENANSG